MLFKNVTQWLCLSIFHPKIRDCIDRINKNEQTNKERKESEHLETLSIKCAKFHNFLASCLKKKEGEKKNERKKRKAGGLFCGTGRVSEAPDAHDQYQSLCHAPRHGGQKRSRPRLISRSQSCFCFSVSLQSPAEQTSFTHTLAGHAFCPLRSARHRHHSHNPQGEPEQTSIFSSSYALNG